MAGADPLDPFAFGVVSGSAVHAILAERMADTVEIVKGAYLAHHQSRASNPHSHFLTFADRPRDRIIALAADLRDERPIAGLKWISSWPENSAAGLPRASAVLVLNRRDTGYPFAVLESSIISAVRTAASAVLAAECLLPDGSSAQRALRIGFVGCGVIARYIMDMFKARRWNFSRVAAFDLDEQNARQFLEHAGAATAPLRSVAELVAQSDIVVFATTAAKPHLTDPEVLRHRPLVLHISLRDLSPQIILNSNNIVDDVDHCLRAQTSVHLAEQESGNREFVSGTIGEAILGDLELAAPRPTIVSPFGMGILDLAVGRFVYDEARRGGLVADIPDFFHERRRW